ncbi:MAG TPA: NAD(P)H-hydrate dehydratase [Steroidobacteraceae bacterium]|jgi:NAD(P)H-hydrate epimerase|nr:NAD(P)H-hydrate dehydratase [Steroidobacteraceae bacterium]
MALPVCLYSTAQVRALDAYAIGTLGVPGYTLMKRAGEAALRYLRTRFPVAHRIVIVCGAGNNGGDGYVLARFAQAAGLTVTTLAATPPEMLRADARQAYEDLRSSGAQVQPYGQERLAEGEVIVDALLGTGLHGPAREQAASVIREINSSGRPVLAVDVPSGLDSDTGVPLGDTVRADCTVTFVGLKTGLFIGDGPAFAGTVFFDDLEIDPDEAGAPPPRVERILDSAIQQALPRRARSSHKGDFGRVLIVGGGVGMPGAVRLAGEACLRVGAGLVTVAVAPENVPAISAGRPELICLPLKDVSALRESAEKADVIAIGPGLGRTPWASAALDAVLSCRKPLVVDADALNIIAESRGFAREDCILTPHPGEAARLLGASTIEVQRDRLAALERLVARYRGTVVLKGAGTLVGAPGRTPALCERGNPGMATAGMGDVLTGTIAGIFAQCRDAWLAARVGVLVHAMAGDSAARTGERGLLASDAARELRNCVNL